MPFTPAHPAAVLPLRHARLLRTAPLVIGAMTPDVPYYLPWRIARYIPQVTHTFLGTLTVDLPIGLLVLVVIWLLRRPLAAPLGGRASAKCLAALERFGSRRLNWVLAPLSLLVGAWTHLAWDSFTHADGWLVSRISALSEPVHFLSFSGELCHLLQYASSVFGLAVMVIWFILLPAPATEVDSGGRAGGALLLALLLLAAAAAGVLQTIGHLPRPVPGTYHLFYLLLTRASAWFALLYTVAGILIARGRRRAVAAATG